MKHPYLAKLLFALLLVSLGFAGRAQAQTGSVSGKVLDSKGTGIPGATVLVEGTTLGGSSNVDGTFNITNVPAGSRTLVISFVGYTSARLPITVVAGQNVEATGTLAENTTQLAEAVVVGYGTQRRQDVTGSIATVDARQFVKGQVTNPEQLIQGKIAGVNITTGGGQPGSSTQIRIRGGSSLTASNSPLIVIDGVPVETEGLSGVSNPLTLINPNDIETYTVLKDASATAIYGSRASNGVILITTKRGLQGDDMHVNFSTQASVAKLIKKVDVLSADEFRQLIATRYGSTPPPTPLGTASTDWQDAIYQRGYAFDNNLSLTGSAGKVPYRVSYGNLNQSGILRTSTLVRNSMSVGVTPLLLNNNLKIDINVKGSIVDNRFADQGAIGGAATFDPTRPIRDTARALQAYNGYFEWTTLDANGRPTPSRITIAPINPVGLLEQKRDRSTVKRLLTNVQLDYKLPFVPGLRANFNIGADFQRGDGTRYVGPLARSNYDDKPELRGENTVYAQNRNTWLNEFYLNYTRDFGSAGRLEVLGGHSFQEFLVRTPNFPGISANGTIRPNTTPAYPITKGEYALESFYGRLNYNLLDRYLLTATMRADRSSRFAKEFRTGYFPAVGFAWRVKNEAFLKDVNVLSDLKVRLGYGITGQQNLGDDRYYSYQPVYTLGDPNVSYQFGGAAVQTLRPEAYVANLKWEETSTYNAGIDYGFADGRITGTLDFYQRKSKDLLNRVQPPAGSNLSDVVVANVGSLENRGVEFAISGQAVRSERFTWNLNFNATFNENKITKLTLVDAPGAVGLATGDNIANAGQGSQILINTVGYPINSFYVLKQKYGADGKPIVPTGGNLLLAYEDLNNDGKITDDDRYRYQQAAPRYTLGFGSNMTYRNFSLSVSMRSNLQNYVYDNVNSGLAWSGNTYNAAGYYNNTTRDIFNTNFETNQYRSDYYVKNANFLRMDNATLGYNFTKLSNAKANLGVSVAVQNVFVLSKYKGIDPEIQTGIDNNFYPRPRTFTLGVNVGF